MAVSYTHLDVYKRQASWIEIKLQSYFDAYGYVEAYVASWIEISKTCLADVYKRQHIGNINPSGQHLTESFWFAGGIPKVQLLLEKYLDLDVMTVTAVSYTHLSAQKLRLTESQSVTIWIWWNGR